MESLSMDGKGGNGEGMEGGITMTHEETGRGDRFITFMW